YCGWSLVILCTLPYDRARAAQHSTTPPPVNEEHLLPGVPLVQFRLQVRTVTAMLVIFSGRQCPG
ncbi:hypothetical protein CFC21_051688, partial [Triticum aestivum]